MSSYLAEQSVAFGQEISVRTEMVWVRHLNEGALKALKTMAQHRSIRFLGDIVSELAPAIRSHAEDVCRIEELVGVPTQ